MPAVNFIVRWPNGEEESCYSPSTVIHEYLKAGEKYSLDDFMSLSEEALLNASERVRERFGYECSAAKDQLKVIRNRIAQFRDSNASSQITVLGME